MRKIILRLVIVGIILTGAAFGVVELTRAEPVEVAVEAVERGTVESTVANTRAGTVRARRRARLAPAIGGQVVSLAIVEGDSVEPGQVLLELWSRRLEAELDDAKAQTERAIALAEEADHRAELAVREAARIVDLQTDGIASHEEVDRAETQAKALQAASVAAHAGARIQVARIAVIEARLEQTKLVAPFAGVVAEINAELGEFVTPSPVGIPTPPAVDLIDRSSLYAQAPIDEVDVPHVKVGAIARITLDAFGDRVFKGVVQRVSPYVLDREKQARTVDVDVEFVDPAEFDDLLPGYSADIEIVLARREDVPRVPTECVLESSRVYVFDEPTGMIVERRVEIGLSSWRFTEIVAGLEIGELVITSLDRAGVEPGVLARIEAAPNAR